MTPSATRCPTLVIAWEPLGGGRLDPADFLDGTPGARFQAAGKFRTASLTLSTNELRISSCSGMLEMACDLATLHRGSIGQLPTWESERLVDHRLLLHRYDRERLQYGDARYNMLDIGKIKYVKAYPFFTAR